MTIGEIDDSLLQWQYLNATDFENYYIEIITNPISENILNTKVKDVVSSVSDIPSVAGVLNIMKHTNCEFSGDLNDQYYNLLDAVIGEELEITIASGSDYTGVIINVSEGDVFILNTKENTESAKAYALLTSENIVIDVKRWANNIILFIPYNAAKLIVNSKIIENNIFLQQVGNSEPVDTFNNLKKSLSLKGNLALLGNTYSEHFKTIKHQYINLLSVEVGQTYTFTTISASNYTYEDISVKPGDIFIGKCNSTTNSA